MQNISLERNSAVPAFHVDDAFDHAYQMPLFHHDAKVGFGIFLTNPSRHFSPPKRELTRLMK